MIKHFILAFLAYLTWKRIPKVISVCLPFAVFAPSLSLSIGLKELKKFSFAYFSLPWRFIGSIVSVLSQYQYGISCILWQRRPVCGGTGLWISFTSLYCNENKYGISQSNFWESLEPLSRERRPWKHLTTTKTSSYVHVWYLHTNTCITYFSAYFSAASFSRCNINQKLPAHSYQTPFSGSVCVCTGKLENFSLRFIVKKRKVIYLVGEGVLAVAVR